MVMVLLIIFPVTGLDISLEVVDVVTVKASPSVPDNKKVIVLLL